MQTHLQTTDLRQLATWCSLHGWLNRFDKGFYLAFATISHSTSSEIRSSMKKSWAKDGQTWLTDVNNVDWPVRFKSYAMYCLDCHVVWNCSVLSLRLCRRTSPSGTCAPSFKQESLPVLHLPRHLKQPSYGVKPIKSRAESQILP